MSKYFITYETSLSKPPYELSDALRKNLEAIPGLKITFGATGKTRDPLVIAEFPEEKLDEVKSLEGIVDVSRGVQYEELD